MGQSAWSSVDHYENFPVASWLVPAHLRPALIALYRFAREADDIADEGDLDDADRLQQLAAWDQALAHLDDPTRPAPPAIEGLKPFIAQHRLPVIDLRALLDAFMQDVRTHRYEDRDALCDYCQRSANPVGHLMLRLFEADSSSNLALSDRICTALQLINFLQDIAVDWRKGRVYLPQDRLRRASITDADIEHAVQSGSPPQALLTVIADEADFARGLLREGAALVCQVPVRLSLELRAILAGGSRLLERLSLQRYDVFRSRPKLGWADAPALARLYLRAAK